MDERAEREINAYLQKIESIEWIQNPLYCIERVTSEGNKGGEMHAAE